jgi:ATP-dependent helicase HrpB
MMSLPIDEVLPELGAQLARRAAVVLQAPPGAGKTTAVPPYLLDAPWLAGRRILLLEPRRLAARAWRRRSARRSAGAWATASGSRRACPRARASRS